ncbi:MAG: NifB/NifX family molybdenum-iron cluster-binding protein [Candidatus Omnitrophica bacterium]|nr:NifB/NifX family molybdenum-iron cluster-binding protein [Candidatus Omnitrophota bacterium]
MKICVTAQGDDLESQVDPRFGRCAYFIFADTESDSFEGVANPDVNIAGGAGIQPAQLVAQKGVLIVFTGNVGPNASNTLGAAGVKMITGVSGTVKSVIEQYKQKC